MPRTGQEPMRRRALIGATIAAIHEAGSLDVTVSQIARRAGVSSALAHHYFGAKDDLLLAAMRHLLAEFGRDAARRLRAAPTPRARLSAVIAASFGDAQFRPETVSAWLAFYVRAQSAAPARRLLRVYARRLHATLVHALRPLAGPRAPRIAEGVAALIDGLYLRQALGDAPPDAASAAALVEEYVDLQLAGARA